METASEQIGSLVKGEDELPYWLLLLHLRGFSLARCKVLVDILGSPKAVFEASAATLQQCGLPAGVITQLQHPSWSLVARDLKWLAADKSHHIIPYTSAHYPPLLLQAPDFPLILFVQGNVAALQKMQLAIVGSRNPSPHGLETTREFAYFLGKAGWNITSGLAMGIDGAAHEGALASGAETIAVAATGLDQVYPARHKRLAAQIRDQGAIVTEFPIGSLPKAAHFPQRNRIISGLSHGVIVIEAALKSGSLITARFAIEQCREVFAVPGSIHSPLSKGCHALIRQGAVLTETITDILQEVAPEALLMMKNATAASKDYAVGQQTVEIDQQKVLYYLGYQAISLESLVAYTALPVERILSILLCLELEGLVYSVPGGYVRAI